MMEATQMTQNWMSHHVKQQVLSNAGSSTTGGNEGNSQLSGKKLLIIEQMSYKNIRLKLFSISFPIDSDMF